MNISLLRKRVLEASSALQVLAIVGAGVAVTGLAAAPAAAQDITAGSMSGTVIDEAGNPVVGASVLVESVDRGFTRTTATSSQGGFDASQLPIGNYTVTISAPGYSTTRADNVAVVLGGAAYSFTLAKTVAGGADGNVIIVSGSAQRRIDFSGTATGIVVDVQQVAERIPISRTIEAIQLLAPGTTSGDTAFGGVSISGSSVAENIYYINGMNITNFRTFVGGTTVPFEFYDQVQVKTGGYQAEFGRNTGGAVIALTRSGSNQFHGGGNISYAPDALRSDSPNTYSQDNSLDERESVDMNIWASGPLIKDRLFFFGFYNPRDSRTRDVTITGVETRTKINSPFYGGKLDLNLFDGHRIEATYFSDNQDQKVLTDGSPSTNFSGGENYILRYTGTFTNWLTVSALYGKSKFNQTSSGADDATFYVLDGRVPANGLVYVSGNPAGVIETGEDIRENFRGDVDLTFSLMGDHHVRFGADYEKLNATDVQLYSGGQYNRFYRTGTTASTLQTGTGKVVIAPNTDYVRIRNLQNGGSFNSKNIAYYIQDDWDLTDKINLSLGVRNDRFENFNANGEVFTDLNNQWAPRVGINYDVFGDQSTRLSAFYGRYYLPVAANTNLRLAGAELFTENFYLLNSANYTGNLQNPALGAKLGTNILSDGTTAPPSTLRSKDLKPQYMDEFILGAERRLGNGFTASINATYRKLGAVLEDTDMDGSGSFRSNIALFCSTQTLAYCNKTTVPSLGGGGYVLVNPGSDLRFDVQDAAGALHEITIPNSIIGLPKAERKYYAVELKLDKAFNGTYGFNASYVWSRSEGNYEGGVKSDNGQDDTGLTQDFDSTGWMDGSYGLLPNHREHTFKLYGSWQPIPNLLFGVNALVQSPREFGCIGTYPKTDGRADGSLAASWYCDVQIAAGNLQGTLGQPIGRGNAFSSEWNKRVDISGSYKIALGALAGLTFRADVFNLFNFKSKLDYNEFGDLDNAGVINPRYGQVTSYQSPRSVRFGASVAF